jgi:17 kDa outer membrane surface antigen
MIGFKLRNGERSARSTHLKFVLPLMAALAAGLGGCSFALPSFLHEDDETASVKLKHSPLSDELDAADWRVAQPALAKVLASDDPQPPVAWTNPATGRGGLFQSVGIGFTREGRKCRAFVAGVSNQDSKSMLQGVGCLTDSGEIALADVGPWNGL